MNDNIKNMNQMNNNDNSQVFYKKIAIVLVLMFILKFGFWLEQLIQNFGLPNLKYQKIWLTGNNCYKSFCRRH